MLAKQRADRTAARAKRARPSIVTMAREAAEALLDALLVAHPEALIAHRDLTEMTDADLRTALEDALTPRRVAGPSLTTHALFDPCAVLGLR